MLLLFVPLENQSLWLIDLEVKSLFTDSNLLLAEITATFYPSNSILSIEH
jgi:hypothetical protein